MRSMTSVDSRGAWTSWLSLSSVWTCASVEHRRCDYDQDGPRRWRMLLQITPACCSTAREHSKVLINYALQCLRACGNFSFSLCVAHFAQNWHPAFHRVAHLLWTESFFPLSKTACSPLLYPPVLPFTRSPLRRVRSVLCGSIFQRHLHSSYLLRCQPWYTCITVPQPPKYTLALNRRYLVPKSSGSHYKVQENFLEMIGRTG